MTAPVFDKLAIVGIGLLGSSIAHAVRAYGGAHEIALWDASEDVRQRAERLVPGMVVQDLSEAVENADSVILCTRRCARRCHAGDRAAFSAGCDSDGCWIGQSESRG